MPVLAPAGLVVDILFNVTISDDTIVNFQSDPDSIVSTNLSSSSNRLLLVPVGSDEWMWRKIDWRSETAGSNSRFKLDGTGDVDGDLVIAAYFDKSFYLWANPTLYELTFENSNDSGADVRWSSVYIVPRPAAIVTGDQMRIIWANPGQSGPVENFVRGISVIPGAPTSLNRTMSMATSARINWTAPTDESNTGILDYQIRWRERTVTPLNYTEIAGITNTHYDLSPLIESTNYEASVRARSAQGFGAWSDFLLFTTPAVDLIPTAPGVSDKSIIRGVAYSVTLPAGTGGDPPLSYTVTGPPIVACLHHEHARPFGHADGCWHDDAHLHGHRY